MNNKLFENYRKVYEQAFVPIFVHDDFDTETLLKGCELAGVRAIEYTLRRDDADKIIPTLKKRYPDVAVFVGSTIDDEKIVYQMKQKYPQLMTIAELAPYVDGLISMLPYSDETILKYKSTHLIIPTAETSGEALRQMKSGATMIKVCGPDFSFSKKLHSAPTFNYCPTFITGGVNLDRMEEAFSMGNVLTAAGFDLILKGEDTEALTAERVADRLTRYIDAAKTARSKVYSGLDKINLLSDNEFIHALPNFFSL